MSPQKELLCLYINKQIIITSSMDKKFLTYEIEELIEKSSFISFVLKGKDMEKWEAFIKNIPILKENSGQRRISYSY